MGPAGDPRRLRSCRATNAATHNRLRSICRYDHRILSPHRPVVGRQHTDGRIDGPRRGIVSSPVTGGLTSCAT